MYGPPVQPKIASISSENWTVGSPILIRGWTCLPVAPGTAEARSPVGGPSSASHPSPPGSHLSAPSKRALIPLSPPRVRSDPGRPSHDPVLDPRYLPPVIPPRGNLLVGPVSVKASNFRDERHSFVTTVNSARHALTPEFRRCICQQHIVYMWVFVHALPWISCRAGSRCVARATQLRGPTRSQQVSNLTLNQHLRTAVIPWGTHQPGVCHHHFR